MCSAWLLRVRWECFKKGTLLPLSSLYLSSSPYSPLFTHFTNSQTAPVQVDMIQMNESPQVKLLYVAAYEPYTNPPTYICVYSLRTPLLLLSSLHQLDTEKLEAQARQLMEDLEVDQSTTNTSNIWELGKFCELSAANSLKTAELLCTPKEFVAFALPDWERGVAELWNSGALLSIRLSRKCLEVAKKVIKGGGGGAEMESDAAKYQLWRLASIVAAHLKRRDIDISFSGNPSPPSPPFPARSPLLSLSSSLSLLSHSCRRPEGVSTNARLSSLCG